MGRATYESIGKPLPHRINVVLTRDASYNPDPSVIVLPNVESVLSEFKKCREIMIIGGESVYTQFLPFANRLYLTEIDAAFEADKFFPEFPMEDYRECYERKGVEDKGYDYWFRVYRKKLK
ncbi:putative dihydrofolate reductase [Bacillus phage PBC6]|nr:putative dihydrofolate reductase [Bacillus phage PBC6]